MRRVLFLAYWVSPRDTIGTIRASHLIKYLPRYGWEVTVVTARFSESDCVSKREGYIETGYFDIKALVKRIAGIGNRSAHEVLNVHFPAYGTKRGIIQRLIFGAAGLVTYPDEHVGWLPFASRTIGKLIAEGHWDAVLTTAPPMTANVAAALSHGAVPWIADLRDLWAEDDSSERSTLQVLFNDKLERATLSRAAALIASSELSAARFQSRYPGKPCYSISTGFDAQEWKFVDFGTEPQCTLLYAGTLYRGKRDPSMLFAALRDIFDVGLAKADELRVDFYTPRERWLLELIARFRLENVVHVHGFLARDAVLTAERRANRLVVLCWDGPTAEGVVPGKLFEYFGARRPILAIGGPAISSVEQLLRKTGAGVHCRTAEETKADLLSALVEHRRGMHRVITEEAVRPYSGEICAQQFAEVLEGLNHYSAIRQ